MRDTLLAPAGCPPPVCRTVGEGSYRPGRQDEENVRRPLDKSEPRAQAETTVSQGGCSRDRDQQRVRHGTWTRSHQYSFCLRNLECRLSVLWVPPSWRRR